MAIAPTLPLALRGSSSLAVEHPAQLGLASVSRAALVSLREVFAAGSDPASRAGLEALEVWRRMEPALRRSAGARGGGRRGSGRRRRPGLEAAVEQLVGLDTHGFPLSTVWLESDGWDTHRGQQPTAAHHLADLGGALGALWSHFAPRRELSVVVSTEFGRTLRPNGSGGTDHGTGSAALVLGTRVRGGVAGEWPGLAESALYEGRDLDPRIDLREVYAEALEAQRRSPVSAAVFPALERRGLGLFEAAHS